MRIEALAAQSKPTSHRLTVTIPEHTISILERTARDNDVPLATAAAWILTTACDRISAKERQSEPGKQQGWNDAS